MFNKVKTGLLNLGLKFISVDEKLVYMILETGSRSLEKITILPVTKEAMQKFVTRMGNTHRQHGLVHNGTINGVKVSAIRCQMGAPYAAIVMEVLHRASVEKVIRCDYAGSISDEIAVGDVIVPSIALGADGTTPFYVGPDVPTEEPSSFGASSGMIAALADAAGKKGYKTHQCTVLSMDGLFRETPERVAKWQAAGAQAIDMETAAIYCVGNLYGMQCGAVLAISDKPGSEYDLFISNKMHDGLFKSLDEAVDTVVTALPAINKKAN